MKFSGSANGTKTLRRLSIALLLTSHSVYAPALGQDESVFTLTLRDSSILALIETVSLRTGKNFIVDPSVKGDVTVISNQPVTADKLYSIFLSVLQVHGYTAVAVGDIVKILPSSKGRQSAVPLASGNNDAGDQLVRKIIVVKNVPARDLVRIMEPMVAEEGLLGVYPAANALFITDRASNIERLVDMIRLIDKPDNNEVEMMRVKHASASDIVRTLAPLQRISVNGDFSPDLMQLLPDGRSNSILVSGSPAVRARVRGLIEQLDQPLGSLGGGIRVIPLRFALAEDLAPILRGTFSTDSNSSEDNDSDLTISAGPNSQNNDDEEDDDDVSDISPDVAPPALPSSSGSKRVIIQIDQKTNSLVVTAPPDDMRNILKAIAELDVRRPQVLVRAVIAEVTEDNLRELGINFLLDGTSKSGPAGYTNLGGATSALANTIDLTNGGQIGSVLESGLAFALGRFGGDGIDFGLLFRAIASDSDNNILSTPTIVTLDNEPAEIVVGSNVPFVTGQQLSADNNNPFQTIERVDVGLTLRVTPQISDDDTIKLVLEQEVSNVNTTAITGAADITTSRRALSTTVLVEDGQTLILGGLIDEQLNDVEEKVPLLGDIPLVGKLFRFKSVQKSKRNLMVFLSPVILRDSDEANSVSNESYSRLEHNESTDQLSLDELTALRNQARRKQADARSASRRDSQMDRNADPDWVEEPDGSHVLRF